MAATPSQGLSSQEAAEKRAALTLAMQQNAEKQQARKQQEKKDQQVRALEVSRSMFSSWRPGSVVKSNLLGQLDFWDEDKAFGFIRTPNNEYERVFCHTSDFSEECNVNDFVKFDVWRSKGSGKLSAINVTRQPCDCIVLAEDQIGTLERPYALIRGAHGQAFRCSEADFEDGSFRRKDDVRFDGVWDGRFKAVNIRHAARVAVAQTPEKPAVAQKVVKTEWSQKEWDQWRSRWSTDEWKAWQRRFAEEHADDASTVASLSLESLD